MRIRLYTGPNCELCEQAKELIYPLLTKHLELQEIDVTQSIETKKNFGLRIPVLAREVDDEELGWPFTANQLKHFFQIN